MCSLKSKLINFLIRNNHIFRGKLKKEVFDFSTSIQAFRDRCEKGAARFGKTPDGITIKPEIIDGIKSEWHIPAFQPVGYKVAEGFSSENDKIILYVHGGGYVSGSCSDHRGVVSKFAKATGFTTLMYEYRLAPEHPFPAAIDDSVRVFEWLLANGFKAANIIIAGESAGGGLCLALLLALKERNIALPKAAVAISPWCDLTCSSESYKTKNKVSPAPLNSWTVFSKYYAGENNTENPLISPLYGDLKGLPPIFINSAMDDELYDDGEKFYNKAKEAGVDITFKAGYGMLHCYPLLSPMFKEATDAMDEITGFVRKQFGK